MSSTSASPMSSSNDEDFISNYLTFDGFTIEIANVDQNPKSPHSLSSTCTQQSSSEISFEYLTQNYEGLELNTNDLIITADQINFINNNSANFSSQSISNCSETDDEHMLDMSSDKNNNGSRKSQNLINIVDNIVIASPNELLASLPVVNSPTIQKTLQTSDSDRTQQSTDNSFNDEDVSDCEELTNLTWLTELKNITNLAPSDQPLTDQPTQRFNKFISQVRRIRENYNKRCDIYRNSSSEKPPFNYAQIIGMAMLEEGRMTLQQICKWIQDNFAYYKEHKNWNNSIRHNLSLNFFFTKVARDKNEKGKGGYWELAMDVTKSERKRTRQRKRNKDGGLNFKRTDNVSNHKNKLLLNTDHNNKNKFSTKISENQRNKNKKIVNERKINMEKNLKEMANEMANEMDEDSEDDLNDNSLNVTENSTNETINYEIIEEQQNINNIIDDSHNAIIINSIPTNGPNVIVETIPTYHFPQIESLDDNELNRLISMNEQELIDDFLNYNENDGNEEEFL